MSRSAYRLPDGWTLHPFDTASREERWLYSAGGRRWQVNGGTAALLRALAAHSSLEAAAAEVARSWGRPVEPAALAAYLERELVPAGMVVGPGETPEAEPARPRPRPLEFLTFRRTLVPARLLFRASGAVAALFHPRLFWLAFAAAVAAAAWVLARAAAEGAPLLDAMLTPGALLFALAAAFAHELGHAAACRRFGAAHGDLGFGVYLVFPVLYMEVDETWKLPRGQRAVVDAGGLYVQVLFGLAVLAVAQAVPALRTAALGALGLIGMALFTNLNPFFRFDGYWLASDLLGVPNLRRKSQDVALRAWRRLRHGPQAGEPVLPADLPPRTAAALGVYAVLSGGFFVFYFGRLLLLLPSYATERYPAAVREALGTAARALEAGAPAHAAAALLGLVPATLLLAGLPLLLLLRLRGVAAGVRRARARNAAAPAPR